MPNKKMKESRGPFIVVIDSGAFVAHMGILRARLGDDIVDKTVQYFCRLQLGSIRYSEMVMGQFSDVVKRRATASGHKPTAVFSCPFFLEPFYGLSEEIIPKKTVYILPSQRRDGYCNGCSDLDIIWNESERHGHVLECFSDKTDEELLLVDNSTEVSRVIEREILKIHSKITPKTLTRDEALEAMGRA